MSVQMINGKPIIEIDTVTDLDKLDNLEDEAYVKAVNEDRYYLARKCSDDESRVELHPIFLCVD